MLKLKRIKFQKSYQILAKDDLSTFKKSIKKKIYQNQQQYSQFNKNLEF